MAPGVDIASRVNSIRPSGIGWGSKYHHWQEDGKDVTCARPLGAVFGVLVSVCWLGVKGKDGRDNEPTPAGRQTQGRTHDCTCVSGSFMGRRQYIEYERGVRSMLSIIGKTIYRWAKHFPWEKVKILVVAWQILAVFSGITGAELPHSYALFLSWINVWNFDIGYILSASCVIPSVNFYQRLLATTLVPFVVLAGLVVTYRMANKRAGSGSAGVTARAAAWSRHVSAGLFITSLVSTFDWRLSCISRNMINKTGYFVPGSRWG